MHDSSAATLARTRAHARPPTPSRLAYDARKAAALAELAKTFARWRARSASQQELALALDEVQP